MVSTVRNSALQRLQPKGPFEENKNVVRTLKDLAKRAQEGGASSIMFLPQKGVKFDSYAFAYHTGLCKEMNIPKPPQGALRGTVIINISGHATGGVADRVMGWVEKSLAREKNPLGDDAAKLVALRTACERAVQDLQSDPQKREKSATIDLSFLAPGKTVELEREFFEQVQQASSESKDPVLRHLASEGDKAMRRFFAACNTYNVRIRLPDGSVSEMRGVARNNPGTLEYSTRIPVEIPPGTTGEVVLEAWPTGSAEVAGYVEARRYKIHVGVDLFDLDKSVQAAEKYQAAHPEIRWNTRFESDDLEQHHVAPSPHPYQDF